MGVLSTLAHVENRGFDVGAAMVRAWQNAYGRRDGRFARARSGEQ
jgi:hypothetical protein